MCKLLAVPVSTISEPHLPLKGRPMYVAQSPIAQVEFGYMRIFYQQMCCAWSISTSFLFLSVCLSKIKSKYKLDNDNCVYVRSAFLSKQSLSILSVLLAELQNYANTGHCSQAGLCASAYMYGRIINTVNLPKNHD